MLSSIGLLYSSQRVYFISAELIHHMDEVNDELLKKITSNQPPKRNFVAQKAQQVHVPLTFQSDPEEVKAWLEAKGFSKP